MLECPGCGGNITFHIESQLMFCKYCDSYYEPYAIHKETDAESVDYYETKVFSCPQCGGEILGNHNEAATFCTYCGSSTILSERISKEECPDYIIPFKKTKEDCKEAYRKAMKKAIFVPKEYKSEEFIDGFRGIYMPYWNYEFKLDGKVHLTAKEDIHQDEYILRNIFHVKGELDDTFLGDAYDASLNFYDDISMGLAPFDFHSHKPFTPSFLSGYYAECGDVSKEVYLGEAMELAQEATMHKITTCDELKTFKLVGLEEGEVPFQTTLVKAAKTLYPVWFMSYRNGDKVAYAAVNGQTGKVAADMPVDKKKYVGYSMLLAIPLFLILNLLFTFSPMQVTTLCAVCLLVTLVLYASELHEIYLKEQFISDKAQMYKNQRYLEYESVFDGNPVFEFLKDSLYKVLEIVAASISVILSVLVYLIPFLPILNWLLWGILIAGTLACTIYALGQIEKLDYKASFHTSMFNIVVMFGVLMTVLIRPEAEIWYYGASVLMLVLVVLNFNEILNNYNYLAMRKMPQFRKKG